jgi:hypothetical protein
MSGQAGGRGYLVQAVVSVLDVLADHHDWVSVAVDPNVAMDKVDILWQYPKRSKVVQVKSSQNQINVPNVKTWATELEKSIVADEYEIRLIGPVSDEVPKLEEHGKAKNTDPTAARPPRTAVASCTSTASVHGFKKAACTVSFDPGVDG